MKKSVQQALDFYRAEETAKKLGVKLKKAPKKTAKKAAKKTAKKAAAKKKTARRRRTYGPHDGSARCRHCRGRHTTSQHWSHAHGPEGGRYATRRGTKAATKKKTRTEKEKFLAAQRRKGRSPAQADAAWRLSRGARKKKGSKRKR